MASEVNAGGCEIAVNSPSSTKIASLKRIPLKQENETEKQQKMHFFSFINFIHKPD